MMYDCRSIQPMVVHHWHEKHIDLHDNYGTESHRGGRGVTPALNDTVGERESICLHLQLADSDSCYTVPCLNFKAFQAVIDCFPCGLVDGASIVNQIAGGWFFLSENLQHINLFLQQFTLLSITQLYWKGYECKAVEQVHVSLCQVCCCHVQARTQCLDERPADLSDVVFSQFEEGTHLQLHTRSYYHDASENMALAVAGGALHHTFS